MAKHPFLPSRLRRRVRRSPRVQRVLWRLEAALVGAVWTLSGWLPPERAAALGAAVMRRLGPRLAKSAHVRRNLAIAFPERSPAQLDALVREVWTSWGAMFLEVPHFGRLADPSRLEVVSPDGDPVRRGSAEPAIFVTAHTANWQLATLAVTRLGMPLTAIYTAESNPHIDRMLRRHRRGLRCALVERERGLRSLVRELAAGRSVGMVVDFRVDEGELISFFGRPAPTTTVPARMALRYDCDLVPVWVERLPGARFRATFFPPIRPGAPLGSPREQARRMTRELHAHFEAWIRAQPGQWICTGRRWPRQVPPRAVVDADVPGASTAAGGS